MNSAGASDLILAVHSVVLLISAFTEHAANGSARRILVSDFAFTAVVISGQNINHLKLITRRASLTCYINYPGKFSQD